MSYAIDLAAWRLTPFASAAEMVAARRSPQYSDPLNGAYREAFEAKVAITPARAMGVSATIKSAPSREMINAVEHVNQTVAAQQEAIERNEAAQALAEQRGNHSLGPQLRIRTPE